MFYLIKLVVIVSFLIQLSDAAKFFELKGKNLNGEIESFKKKESKCVLLIQMNLTVNNQEFLNSKPDTKDESTSETNLNENSTSNSYEISLGNYDKTNSEHCTQTSTVNYGDSSLVYELAERYKSSAPDYYKYKTSVPN